MTQSIGAVALNTLLLIGLIVGNDYGVIDGLWPWALLIVVTIPLGWALDDWAGRSAFPGGGA